MAPPSDPAARLQRALDDAYRYLSRRDRTAFEVRRHLEGRRVEPDAIEQAVAELQAQGYLDDARYARVFAEDRRALDGWGPDRIARRLAQAGVDLDHVEAALAGRGRQEELEAAVELLRRKLRVTPEGDRDRERALGLLVRRGYELEMAYEAVRAFEREG
jgi:regulatory protein